MLTINPSKRITAAEALKHPWISVSLPQQALPRSPSRPQDPDPHQIPPQAWYQPEGAQSRRLGSCCGSQGESGNGRGSELTLSLGVPLALNDARDGELLQCSQHPLEQRTVPPKVLSTPP